MSLLSLTSGLRVFVTDGAVGIGQAIAERLVTAGARVFIRGAGRDGLARATERKPANNRAMMLIGDGRETNPDSDVFVCVDDRRCGWQAGLHRLSGSWDVAKHTIALRSSSQMPTV
jgi:NAD(P)-dependent dehydrogenase (short-subunit alcohol dehydrogenase family)